MKRIASILILSIMLINAAGFYMYYAVQLSAIKREMRMALKRLPDHRLQVLKLSQEEYLDARQDEHEIRFHGKMYDVARVKLAGDSVVVYGIHDEKEDNLLVFIQEIVSKPLTNADSIPEAIIEYLALTYVCPENDMLLQRPEITVDPTSDSYLFALKIFQDGPGTPPPWKSFSFLV